MQGILIQCRLSSSRLPCKALLDLKGKTLLGRVIERMKLTNVPVFVITSDLPEDDLIEHEARKSGAKDIYRGSLLNVRDRFFKAAEHFNLKHIARVTADNPFSDPRFVTKGFECLSNGARYARARQDWCPDGTNVELFELNELKKSIDNDPLSKNLFDAEHVTPEIINRLIHTDGLVEFNTDLSDPLNSSLYHLGVDTPEDYIKIRRIYEFINPDNFKQIDLLDNVMSIITNEYPDYPKGRRHEIRTSL